ncbi:MAG: polysaccharide deacetylase family protein [Prolixibacteraceae bacterium]|jgi:peptidoglycan/xylan/chitin deacetylase (PgdA/CDA1 family)|nr:polysaccharide deacetylase family protein [Prolixibacteraceae bacterium]
MNEKVKNIIAASGQLIPLNWLTTKNQPPFLPFYHIVSDSHPDYISFYSIRNPKLFEKELDFLLKHFNAVDLDTLLQQPKQNDMHLTFDDGLTECISTIAPMLKRKGIPATFFVSPDFIDNKALFHRFKRAILEKKGIIKPGGKRFNYRQVNELDQIALQHQIDFTSYKPYLTSEQLQQLHNMGFNIGAHSMYHPEMWLMNENEQFEQIANSMKWISDRFNPKIKAFSFPFTDQGIQPSVFEKIINENIADITFGTAGLKHDIAKNHFQRVPIERKEFWSIKKNVHFEYFYYFVRSLLKKNNVTR